MGRKAGVAAGETKAQLLEAAAKLFARSGYDGTSISDICSEAGVTSGAVYAHYASKAELFVATLQANMERDLDRLLGDSSQFVDLVESLGAQFDHREPTEESLLVSAIIAAGNHPEVEELLSKLLSERERFFTSLVAGGQESGVIDGEVSAAAISRLSLMIALGSLLVGPLGLDPPNHDEWADLIKRVVGSFRANN